MNCDTFLADLETGSFLKRRRARRHACACPGCAAALAALNAARNELSSAPPLAPELRQLWARAAETTVIRPPVRSRKVIPITAAAVAACLLLFVGLKLRQPEDRPPEKDIAQLSPIQEIESTARVAVIDPVRELSELAEAVDELESELKELERFAERHEAERQFALLLKRVEVW
jgi:hypothetical protein